MNKFENVDVLAVLEQIMRQNTAFYQDDFEIDKDMLRKAAASDKAEDKTLLWMSRPSGTYCFRERDVFLKDTRQYNTWKFYGEQTRDHVLAYVVELTGKVGGKIRGTLYELDYQQHFRHVIAEAVKADNLILHYEKGDKEQPAAQYFNGSPDPKLGAFLRYEAKPNEPENLREVLRQEQRSREPCPRRLQKPRRRPAGWTDYEGGPAHSGRNERAVRPQQSKQDTFHGGAVPILCADRVQQGH